MTYDPPGDPLEFLGAHMTQRMPQYGAELVVASGETREIKLVRCSQLEAARRQGLGDVGLCEAHEAWWDVQARSIRTSPRVRITKKMRDGDPYCLVLARR